MYTPPIMIGSTSPVPPPVLKGFQYTRPHAPPSAVCTPLAPRPHPLAKELVLFRVAAPPPESPPVQPYASSVNLSMYFSQHPSSRVCIALPSPHHPSLDLPPSLS